MLSPETHIKIKDKKPLNKVDFNIIRYANCWEDVDILLEGLNVEQNKKILSIGSAGDNSFSLLITNPEKVVVVDISKIQLYLIELKKAAFIHLSYDEFLAFLGFTECASRIQLFSQLKSSLSVGSCRYWEQHIEKINEGVIYYGKFENYFHLFRTRLLPLIHSIKTIEQLFEKKSAEDQHYFYNNYWNNWRWRFVFKLFFSRTIMGRLGRDPEFLKQVKTNVSDCILSRTENHFKSTKVYKNHFLHFIVKGYFDKNLPHYARKENFEIIKENIDKLILVEGLIQDACRFHGKFHYFNLSNIFEYMDTYTFKTVVQEIINGSETDAKYAYWNLMVERDMASCSQKLYTENELSKKLTEKDKCFFYYKFLLSKNLNN